MSTTKPVEVSTTSVYVNGLRAELKEWEKAFADANNGRKAGRDDIKKNPNIAQKYKEYTKLRAQPSTTETSIHASSSPPPAAKKRKLVPPNSDRAPRPTQAVFQTHTLHPADLDLYDSPRIHLPTYTPPHHRTSIGPTPQKNGTVLGLFDLLSPASASKHATPSKSSPLNPISQASLATPSKRSCAAIGFEAGNPDSEDVMNMTRRHSRTPQSASKRICLSLFLTPSTRRANAQHTPSNSKSSIVARKLQFDDTPEFLRRDSQRMAFPLGPVGWESLSGNENGEKEGDALPWSPVAVRMPAKPAGKGLSALVRGLRGMEDERLDEELDVLREIEAEEEGVPKAKEQRPQLLVRDSQVEMPLGPDRPEEESDEDGKGDQQTTRDGKLKVWKKKGQKRTTRRIIMKPGAGKWKPEPMWKGEEEEKEMAEETQGNGPGPKARETETGEGTTIGKKPGAAATVKEIVEAASSSSSSTAKVNAKAKPPKKVSATAHANFRALKIKNKQAKAKRGGKFGRKR